MTNEEILKKAISKAVDNGWDMFGRKTPNKYISNLNGLIQYILKDNELKIYTEKHGFGHTEKYSIEKIIFSHDFAKAIWNSKSCYHNGSEMRHRHTGHPDSNCGQAHWQYHLQQMVLEEDPIKYLKKFI